MRCAAVVILVLASTLSGAPAPQTDVTELIVQLSSDDYHARQAAADQLVGRGDAVRPQIEKLTADPTDAERRNLAAGILARLDQQDREGPTFITLHAHQAEAQTVLEDFATQSKVAMHFSNNAARSDRMHAVAIDLDHKPLWIAIAEFCRLTQTHVRTAEADGGIEFGTGQNNDSLDGPLCQAGPFTVAVVSATRNRQLHYGDAGRGVVAADSIDFELFLDPKSHPLEQPVPTIDEAVDDAGRPLLQAVRGRTNWPALRGKWMRGFSTELSLGPDAHTLKRLHGAVDATFAVAFQTITIANVQTNLNQPAEAGDTSVEITAAAVGPHGGTYTLSFKRTKPGLLNLSGLRLVDAGGAVLFEARGSVMISGPNAFSLSGAFNRSGGVRPPVSLVWDVPTRIETVHESFEFANLPLP